MKSKKPEPPENKREKLIFRTAGLTITLSREVVKHAGEDAMSGLPRAERYYIDVASTDNFGTHKTTVLELPHGVTPADLKDKIETGLGSQKPHNGMQLEPSEAVTVLNALEKTMQKEAYELP